MSHYKIIDDSTKKVVEEESSEKKACRSLHILTAHERKNGRTTRYSINPPVDVIPWRECDLPSWAKKELTRVEQIEKATEFLEKTQGHPTLAAAMSEHIKEMIEPSDQARRANLRSPGYENMSAREQWEDDKALGILDWDGK